MNRNGKVAYTKTRTECGINERVANGWRGRGWARRNILDEPIVTPRRLQSIFQEKVDRHGQGRRAQWRSPEPGIYNETKKGFILSFSHLVLFVFVSSSSFFLVPTFRSTTPSLPSRWCTPRCCLTCPTSKFTLYRHSTKPPGPFGALLKIEDAICLAGLRRRPTCSK